jgi:hypothetical protein
MYLSYSGWSKLEACAFAYWNEYENRTKVDAPDDRLGSVYGSVVGLLMEDFYILKIWKAEKPQQALLERVRPTIDKVIKKETTPWKDRPAGVLMWKGSKEGQNPKALYTNIEELEADVRDTIPRAFRSVRHHKLLGPRTDAEYKLDYVKGDDIIAGRADFIIKRVAPHSDLLIIDGKGSRHRAKYVDPDQLRWYAMLFWLHTKTLPDQLAFLFWRFEPLQSMDWISISEFEVEELYERVQESFQSLQTKRKLLVVNAAPAGARNVYTPNPNEDNCRFCPYATPELCPKGVQVQKEIADRAAAKRKR